MIVDTSTIMAIARKEPGFESFLHAIVANIGSLKMSAGNWPELEAVLIRGGDRIVRDQAEAILAKVNMFIVAVDLLQATAARTAYRTFGRGTGHRASLNFGDCFAYALAKDTGEPLLFNGEDFVHTDIVPAL